MLDLAFGELPNALHPVAWLGRLIAWGMERAPRAGHGRQLAYGAGLTLAVVGIGGGGAHALYRIAGRVPGGRLVVGALLVKCSLSVRMLAAEARRVERSLRDGDEAGAREALRSLVSRDTSGLGEALLAAAAIESVAENASDSVVAPLLYHLALGPAGAFAYRAANTLDSMVGYHGRYEYLGKVAARVDDVLNLAPSRLTALLMVGAALPAGLNPRESWRITMRDHDRTESPNAGWPMAAMAGALGRRLEKVDHYALGEGPLPRAADIDRSIRLLTAALALGGLALLAGLFGARRVQGAGMARRASV